MEVGDGTGAHPILVDTEEGIGTSDPAVVDVEDSDSEWLEEPVLDFLNSRGDAEGGGENDGGEDDDGKNDGGEDDGGEDDGGDDDGGEDDDGEEDGNGAEDCISTPAKGMEFESALHVISHVHRYGFANGFQIRIRSSHLKGEGRASESSVPENTVPKKHAHRVGARADSEHYQAYTRLRLICSKGGLHKPTNPLRPSHSARCDCKFVVNVNKCKESGRWKMTTINLLHNHDLDRSNSKYMPRYRNISKADEAAILKNDMAGVKIASNYHTFVVHYRGFGNVPFTEKDMRNRIIKGCRSSISGGDFNAMEQHFHEMRKRSPGFYYEYNVEDGILVNVFWADARSIAAAKDFGDVISFDSTYVTNRYRMPFAPFIGLNHHGNSILLGCALITKEDAKSYEWVFGAWLRCMGSAPTGILTDQCKSIGKAVGNAFPSSKHRLCIWHIRRNLAKNMGSSSNWSELKSEFFKLNSHKLTEEEFEDGWKKWVEKYSLEDKLWCKDLHNDRKKWAPVYFRGEFWAGMTSTQRSEGMNSFFKEYVDSHTTLKVFLDKYGMAVERKASLECNLKFTDNNRRWSKVSDHVFETVFEQVFTVAKYKKIQEQVARLKNCNGTKVYEDETEVRYEILMCIPTEGLARKRNFKVCLKKANMELKCECCNFEFKGIFCCHTMQVLLLEGIDVVPERYVFSRWRKDIPKDYLKEKLPYDCMTSANLTPSIKRYDEVTKACGELATAVMESEELFKMVMQELKKVGDKVSSNMESRSLLTSKELAGVGKVYGRKGADWQPPGAPLNKDSVGVKDPADVRRRRGRPPTVRKGVELEKKISSAQKQKTRKRKGSDSESQHQNPAVFGAPPVAPYVPPFFVFPGSNIPVPFFQMGQPSVNMPFQMGQPSVNMLTNPMWMQNYGSFPPPRNHPNLSQSPCASSQAPASSQNSSDQSDGMLRMKE